MTSTGVSCFTRSARSRSSSSSGKGSGFWVLGSQPVSALVRNTPARSLPSSDRGASRACRVRPTWRWATTKGAGMISKPNTRCIAACFTRAPMRAPKPLPSQVGGDALQRLRQVGPSATAGVQNVDVLGGQPVLDAQDPPSGRGPPGPPCSAPPRRGCTRRRAACAVPGRRLPGTARRSRAPPRPR